jgi:hypothetical protein
MKPALLLLLALAVAWFLWVRREVQSELADEYPEMLPW